MITLVKEHHRANTIADIMADRARKLESFTDGGITRVFYLLYGSVIRVTVVGSSVELHEVSGEDKEVIRARHHQLFQ